MRIKPLFTGSYCRYFPSFLTLVFSLSVALLVLISGCKPESATDLGVKADASFTMTPVPNRVNTFLLTSTSTNAFGYQWDKGNGTFVKGKQVDTAYFPLKGTYKVQLRAFGRGGYDTASQSVTILVDDILNNPQFILLTSKVWKLHPTDPAPIIVGTEANPAQYFGGGALADCQKDDTYTFTTGMKLNYASAGSTFNGGNIAPNFNCGSDRSYSNQDFTFAPGATGAGIATITLPGTTIPSRFIGVTDISSNNYRIISISATAMVLRSGTSTETVHQFKFVAQ